MSIPDHVKAQMSDTESQLIAIQVERDRLRSLLIACGNNAGAALSDSVSTEFLTHVPEEIRLKVGGLVQVVDALNSALAAAEAERDQLKALLNTPEVEEFDKAIPLEAAHQQVRWGAKHDEGKTPADWFWLIGYLAGKALAAHITGDTFKAKHHCISTAAALRNWHAHIRTGGTEMRPGLAADKVEGLVS